MCHAIHKNIVPLNIYICFQKESEIQGNLVADIGNVKGYIDIHAYSQFWMYPYGYTSDKCKDDDILVNFTATKYDLLLTVIDFPGPDSKS